MKRKILKVKWQDASGSSSWEPIDRPADDYIVETVGFFVGETGKVLSVAQSVSSENHRDYTMHIPKKMIISKRVLNERKSRRKNEQRKRRA